MENASATNHSTISNNTAALQHKLKYGLPNVWFPHEYYREPTTELGFTFQKISVR